MKQPVTIDFSIHYQILLVYIVSKNLLIEENKKEPIWVYQ